MLGAVWLPGCPRYGDTEALKSPTLMPEAPKMGIMKTRKGLVMLLLLCFATACSSESVGAADGSTTKGTGKSCVTISDCPFKHVCMDRGAGGQCTKLCAAAFADTSSCGTGMVCITSSAGNLSFCRTAPSKPEEVVPEKEPRMVCEKDADCSMVGFCGTRNGRKECVRPCIHTTKCQPVNLFSILSKKKVILYTCQKDETKGKDRIGCFLDEKCIKDIASCIE